MELKLFKQGTSILQSFDDNIRQLDLHDQDLYDIVGLDQLTSLRELNLMGNNFLDFLNIDRLVNLRRLNLSGNRLTRIPYLNIPSLIDINLSSNSIRRIENLQHLLNLKVLNLNHNQIEIIEGLNNCNSLVMLYLSDNRIQNLDNISDFRNLMGLYLSGNPCVNHVVEMPIGNSNVDEYLFHGYLFGYCSKCGNKLESKSYVYNTAIRGHLCTSLCGNCYNNLKGIRYFNIENRLNRFLEL